MGIPNALRQQPLVQVTPPRQAPVLHVSARRGRTSIPRGAISSDSTAGTLPPVLRESSNSGTDFAPSMEHPSHGVRHLLQGTNVPPAERQRNPSPHHRQINRTDSDNHCSSTYSVSTSLRPQVDVPEILSTTTLVDLSRALILIFSEIAVQMRRIHILGQERVTLFGADRHKSERDRRSLRSRLASLREQGNSHRKKSDLFILPTSLVVFVCTVISCPGTALR